MSLSPASILYDSSGNEKGVTGNPVKTDPTGTTAQPVTDNGGTLSVDDGGGTITVDGTVNVGNLPAVQPVSDNGGSLTVDGTVGVNNFPAVQPVNDNGGSLTIDSPAVGALNATTPTSAILLGADDGTNIRDLQGRIQAPLANDFGLITRNIEHERATFVVCADAVTIGNNKSMFSIVNASGSAVVARIMKIYIANERSTALVGIIGTFQIRRIVNHSAGTLLTSVTHDTSDSQNASITCRTGSTVTTESTVDLRVLKWSTDEYRPGTLDQEGLDHALQNLIPLYQHTPGTKPITLRANEGLTVKFATNSTAGSFTISVEFTQE